MNFHQFVYAFCALMVITATLPIDGATFPDHRRTESHQGGCGSQCSRAIPISLAKKLSNIDSTEEFLRQFVENGDELASANFNRFDRISPKSPFAQSNATERIPSANCMPESRTISLQDPNEPTLVYSPMCVRLEQCGGCCNQDLLQCQPNKTSQFNVTVVMSKYVGNNTLEYIGQKTVTLMKHEECSCDCKTKPEDCTERQEYKKDECRCRCTNKKEEDECNKNEKKTWDESTCKCSCIEEKDCTNGFEFNYNTCECDKEE